MLFGAFDWTQVLVAAGVGAVLGAAVWMIRKGALSGKAWPE